MSNEVLNLETIKATDVYNGEALDDVLAKVEAEAKSHTPDISTPQGREEIASVAYRVARTKTALDGLGKELTEEARKTVDQVNAERKRMRDRLDTLKEEVRAPLTAWENKEKTRVADLEERLENLRQVAVFTETPTADSIQEAIDAANALYQYDWQEFMAKADLVWHQTNPRLLIMLDERKKHDAEQEELARLRREAEEREKRDREEKLKKDAADAARKEAEAKAAREAAEKERKAKAEQERVEREKKEAEERAAAAEQARKDAEEKAKRDAEEAAKRAEEEKKQAVEAERKRKEDEERRQREETERREADKQHRQKIYNESLLGIQKAGIGENDARKILDAIRDGAVPHVKVIY